MHELEVSEARLHAEVHARREGRAAAVEDARAAEGVDADHPRQRAHARHEPFGQRGGAEVLAVTHGLDEEVAADGLGDPGVDGAAEAAHHHVEGHQHAHRHHERRDGGAGARHRQPQVACAQRARYAGQPAERRGEHEADHAREAGSAQRESDQRQSRAHESSSRPACAHRPRGDGERRQQSREPRHGPAQQRHALRLDQQTLAHRDARRRARRLERGRERGDRGRHWAEGEPQQVDAAIRMERGGLVHEVEVGQRARHQSQRAAREPRAEHQSQGAAHHAEAQTLRQEQSGDAAPRDAQRAQHADLAPPAQHRHRHRIEDQEGGDEERDERQRGEIERKGLHHALDLAGAAARRVDAGVRRQQAAQGLASGVASARIDVEIDAIDPSEAAQHLLRGGDVDDRHVAAEGVFELGRIEQPPHHQRLGASRGQHGERVAEAEPVTRRESSRHRRRTRIRHECERRAA